MTAMIWTVLNFYLLLSGNEMMKTRVATRVCVRVCAPKCIFVSVYLSVSLSFITPLCSGLPCTASSPLTDEQTEVVLQDGIKINEWMNERMNELIDK